MKRRYELKERARRQAETRQRIVEAAVGLHTSIGPSRTTVSAVAERAGVERHTVYAHFPDDESLYRACSQHFGEQHPSPDPQRWAELDPPAERLRRLLLDLYEWFEQVEGGLTVILRDATLVPAQGEALAELAEARAEAVRVAERGWPRRKAVRAAVAHAFEFETWRSLARRQGLSRAQAVDAMVRLAEAL